MLQIDTSITPSTLRVGLDQLWPLAGEKIRSIQSSWDHDAGAPVITRNGKYTARGWTEWTQGFQFGAAILQFDVTDESYFLDLGRNNTVRYMASHVSHIGVHDHGFNNVSTYGNLRRLMLEGRIDNNPFERDFYELALKLSGAIQAARWTDIADNGGYIYSFNGPHSLFSDTIRSLRALVLAHELGHVLMGENDRKISLLHRAVSHAMTTARFNVWYGTNRDIYDVRGRVAHESIFNTNDGNYRCPSTQQGYSPFSTWTRCHAWIMLGFAEQLEYFANLDATSPFTVEACEQFGGYDVVIGKMHDVAVATCDFYIANSPTDGVPYWDTGAPGLAQMGDYLNRPSDPFNDHEPVDSSAAAIAAQGLIRLGSTLTERGDIAGARYLKAGLTVLRNLLTEPFLSTETWHQGLLLHTIYHQPNGWDHIPNGSRIPYGESCMWGDYHFMEAALLVHRMIEDQKYLTFWS